jgi:hypothetical protein
MGLKKPGDDLVMIVVNILLAKCYKNDEVEENERVCHISREGRKEVEVEF